MSLAYSTHEARRTPREAVDCQSLIWSPTLPPSPALIVNISPHGCMVRSDRSVPIGGLLTVDVPEIGALRGMVIWSLGTRLGMEFEEAIELDLYVRMLAQLKSALRAPATDEGHGKDL